MRKLLFALMLVGLAGAVIAGTISQAFTQRQIRDPRKLETILEDNFAEIDNRTDGTTAIDIQTDDINMAGSVSDTLGLNDTKAASVTGLAVTVKYDIGGTALDTDYINHIWLQMANDSSEDIDWAYWYVVVDDNTTNTEDSAVELYIQSAGTATKALDINTTGVDCGAGQILATGGDMGDGALANVGALTCDSVDGDAAATLTVGPAVATRVDVGASDAVTKILGGLNLKYANKTANYTNTVDDCVLSFDTSAATTNTLPEASTVLGAVFVIALQDDDGDLVVMTDGTDKFDGTNDILTFADAGDSCVLMATAANVYTILVNVGGTLSN